MAIGAGTVHAYAVRFPGEINSWRLLADPAGAAVVDVRKAADLAAFNAGTYATICAGSKPTLPGGSRAAEGDALGVWSDVTLDVGNVIVFVVESCDAGITWLAPRLEVRRT